MTAKTLHDVQCPLWTSVHAEFTPSLEEIHCHKILCSVDLGECSENILAWAAWLAGEYQASLGIVHATAATDALDAEHYLRDEFARYVSAQARARIDALQAKVGIAAEMFINPGKPNMVVGRAAEEFAADLLVIGRHESVGVVGDLF